MTFSVSAQNPGDNVFSGIQVHTINIKFSQPNYWDSLVYYYNQGLEQFIPATVILDGLQLDSVGVRLKGNSSFSHPNNKKSIRLSFGEYRDDQRWDELKGIHLNNCYGDPTFMREKIHLDFCRSAGIAAPRANFANVFINDTLFAFYSMIEHVDKRFLGSRYGDNSGDLFKAVDAFEGIQAASDFRWFTSVPDSYYTRYEMKTDGSTTAWGQLVTLLDSINNGSSPAVSFPSKMNMTALNKGIATDILFANLDSYNNSGRNFYFYFNPLTSKMEWIVWDVGLTFGCYGGGVSNFENLSVTYLLSSTYRPLMGKVLSNASLKNDYLFSLCQLFNNHFTTSNLFADIDSVANIIRPYVYADPRKQYTNTQFEMNILTDLPISGVAGTSRIPGLKSFINSRRTSVQTQLTNLGVNCDFVLTQGDVVINEFMAQNDSIPDPAGQFDDWIEIYNNTNQTINLGGLYLTDNATNPSKWQFPANTTIGPYGFLIVWADEDSLQAGLHANFKLSANGEFIGFYKNDLSVLDTITFGAQTSNLSMARIPNGTGNFVQTQPTFNAVNVLYTPAGDVVINEFMAQNNTIPDPSGEFDDWIEMYNNTNQPINLSGYYFSDKYSNPTKWTFPTNTIIEANSFLIVWADENEGQLGLHANFKLSVSGEQIIFSKPDLTVIDSITFGVQTADLSMARIPNGTGPFVQGQPTFNASNTPVKVENENSVSPSEFMLCQNYPNPFNPSTKISWQTPVAGWHVLKVFDILGNEIITLVNEYKSAGRYEAELNMANKNLSSGIYFYRLTAFNEASSFIQTKQMMLVK